MMHLGWEGRQTKYQEEGWEWGDEKADPRALGRGLVVIQVIINFKLIESSETFKYMPGTEYTLSSMQYL